ncbi:MAG: hypothetical protein ABW007_18925 [Chitinophagaceae bacterium]
MKPVNNPSLAVVAEKHEYVVYNDDKVPLHVALQLIELGYTITTDSPLMQDCFVYAEMALTNDGMKLVPVMVTKLRSNLKEMYFSLTVHNFFGPNVFGEVWKLSPYRRPVFDYEKYARGGNGALLGANTLWTNGDPFATVAK